MSKWTHVAGLIRIDHIPIHGNLELSAVVAICQKGIPTGSEGSMQVTPYKTQVWTPKGGSVNWGWIGIEGDLRDYENVEEIEQWVKEFTKILGGSYHAILRQGILIIEVEGNSPIIFYWDSGSTWKEG